MIRMMLILMRLERKMVRKVRIMEVVVVVEVIVMGMRSV